LDINSGFNTQKMSSSEHFQIKFARVSARSKLLQKCPVDSQLADCIENDIFLFCHRAICKQYYQKLRTIIFALVNNSELSNSIIIGTVTPHDLVHLPTSQLATKDQMKKRRGQPLIYSLLLFVTIYNVSCIGGY
jgi:hypothetical protein